MSTYVREVRAVDKAEESLCVATTEPVMIASTHLEYGNM